MGSGRARAHGPPGERRERAVRPVHRDPRPPRARRGQAFRACGRRLGARRPDEPHDPFSWRVRAGRCRERGAHRRQGRGYSRRPPPASSPQTSPRVCAAVGPRRPTRATAPATSSSAAGWSERSRSTSSADQYRRPESSRRRESSPSRRQRSPRLGGRAGSVSTPTRFPRMTTPMASKRSRLLIIGAIRKAVSSGSPAQSLPVAVPMSLANPTMARQRSGTHLTGLPSVPNARSTVRSPCLHDISPLDTMLDLTTDVVPRTRDLRRRARAALGRTASAALGVLPSLHTRRGVRARPVCGRFTVAGAALWLIVLVLRRPLPSRRGLLTGWRWARATARWRSLRGLAEAHRG